MRILDIKKSLIIKKLQYSFGVIFEWNWSVNRFRHWSYMMSCTELHTTSLVGTFGKLADMFQWQEYGGTSLHCAWHVICDILLLEWNWLDFLFLWNHFRAEQIYEWNDIYYPHYPTITLVNKILFFKSFLDWFGASTLTFICWIDRYATNCAANLSFLICLFLIFSIYYIANFYISAC